ncbi:MAG TPA: tetratricopeptide repeat protein [Thermodesulfobacteriota bacterium]|nr:tetratricopeptide repeat protein [Thermodesulfobacteriota bacterium]
MFVQYGFRGALLVSVLSGMLGCATIRAGVEYNRALEAFKNHHYEMAENHLHSALKKNPGEERATSLLGWVRFKQGRTEEARKLFTEAYQHNPENIATMEGLGWVQYLSGQNENAEKEFRKLTAYAEKHLRHPNWTEYPVDDRRFIESIYSEASYALGLIAKRKGMWASARDHFENALNHPNQFIDREIIAKELADILFQLGEYRAALIFYKEFLSENPQDLSLLNRTAWCLYQIGSIEEAKSLYLRSKKISSLAAEYYRESLGSQSVTRRLYAKRMAEPHYGLALIYAREKQLGAALEELASALKISPFFHHPKEISLLLDRYPEWQETLRLRSLGRPLP